MNLLGSKLHTFCHQITSARVTWFSYLLVHRLLQNAPQAVNLNQTSNEYSTTLSSTIVTPDVMLQQGIISTLLGHG